jgi:osmoprotectant transport system permease protein
VSLLDVLRQNRAELAVAVLQHTGLVAAAVGAAAAVGVPIGILLTRRPSLSRPVLAVANVLQTVPSLALFGFLIPVLGIGRVPAILALFLYGLLPILRNTFTGIGGVDPSVREAGKGLGMTDWQLLTRVELPLALPVITAGVRIATVISIGTATVAAAVGAGGLGTYIFRGLRMNDASLILAGAVPAALMAMLADGLLAWLERSLAPGPRAGRRTGRWVLAGAAGLAVLGGAALALRGSGGEDGARAGREGGGARGKVVVGSKDFTEQVIVAEIIAQAIESGTGLAVERRFELGGDLAHRALLSGEIDLYPEYTGTALTAILRRPPMTDPRAVYEAVKGEYAQRFHVAWQAPLGFDNTFAILVRSDVAKSNHLVTISDAVRFAPTWRAGFGQDFVSREDGYPGFVRAYGLRFAEPPREMDLALTYRALSEGKVDLIAGNSTDGLIDALGLVQLADDKRYFPPYEAAVVVRDDTLARHPELAAVLGRLGGAIDAAAMRRLNYAVDGEHRDVKDVARELLGRLGR